jgi:hypothetical protein
MIKMTKKVIVKRNICGVEEGSLIDVFCQVRPEYAEVDPATGKPSLHNGFEHAYFFGDDTFREGCYDDGVTENPAIFGVLLGSATTNSSGNIARGIHVDDPSGSGIGIDDFTEQAAFGQMENYYYTFSGLNNQNPYSLQTKAWYYGAEGETNISAEVLKVVAADPSLGRKTRVFFRNASEAFVKNVDMHGNPQHYSESIETAFNELLYDEKVDRIVVFSASSGYANVINYGPHWRDEYGEGVSMVPGKTYAECIDDVTDGYGPATIAERDTLVAEKPWDMYKSVMREVSHVNAGRAPLSFTKAYGESVHYDSAVLAMLNHAIEKYDIPSTAALKVVLTSHGYASGWRDGAACDAYFRSNPVITDKVISFVKTHFNWNGKLAVVPGPIEYAQPGEGTNFDPPSKANPFGAVISAGEQVDMAIKGRYINELGKIVNNGSIATETNDVYDYVLLIPTNFDAESSDTLGHARADVLGNMESGKVEGNIQTWVRQHHDQNDGEYGDPASSPKYFPFHDEENYTHRTMDASGWCSKAKPRQKQKQPRNKNRLLENTKPLYHVI